jgi:hypothetical protein
MYEWYKSPRRFIKRNLQPAANTKKIFDVTYNEIFAERKSQSIKIPLGLVEKDADVLNPHKYITDS